MWKFCSILIVLLFWGTSVYSQVFTQTYYDRCTGEVKIVTANFTNNNSATVSFYNKIRTFTVSEVMDGTLLRWMDETYMWWYTLSPCSIQTQQTQNIQLNLNNTSNTVSNIPTSNNNENKVDSNIESGSTESSDTSSNDSSDEQDSNQNEEDSDEQDSDNKPMPIMVSGDIITMQNLTNSFDNIISTGISKSSLYGDASYNANLLIWDNLNQFSLGGSYSKSFFENKNIEFIENYNISYIYSYGVNSINIGYNKIIPKNKIGIFGYGINKSIIFGKNINNYIININYNILYTNTIKLNRNIIYSAAFILSSSPISYYNKFNNNIISKDIITVLSNGFDYKITKRFKFNVNYTLIKSSNVNFPILNSFIIGSKIII